MFTPESETVNILALLYVTCRLPAAFERSSGDSNNLMLLNCNPSPAPGSLNTNLLIPIILQLFISIAFVPPPPADAPNSSALVICGKRSLPLSCAESANNFPVMSTPESRVSNLLVSLKYKAA